MELESEIARLEVLRKRAHADGQIGMELLYSIIITAYKESR